MAGSKLKYAIVVYSGDPMAYTAADRLRIQDSLEHGVAYAVAFAASRRTHLVCPLERFICTEFGVWADLTSWVTHGAPLTVFALDDDYKLSKLGTLGAAETTAAVSALVEQRGCVVICFKTGAAESDICIQSAVVPGRIVESLWTACVVGVDNLERFRTTSPKSPDLPPNQVLSESPLSIASSSAPFGLGESPGAILAEPDSVEGDIPFTGRALRSQFEQLLDTFAQDFTFIGVRSEAVEEWVGSILAATADLVFPDRCDVCEGDFSSDDIDEVEVGGTLIMLNVCGPCDDMVCAFNEIHANFDLVAERQALIEAVRAHRV